MYIPRTKIKVASDSDRRKVPHTQDDKPDQISHPVDSILSPDNAKPCRLLVVLHEQDRAVDLISARQSSQRSKLLF